LQFSIVKDYDGVLHPHHLMENIFGGKILTLLGALKKPTKDKFLAKRYYDQSIEVNPNEAMIPATIAILYLNAEDYLGHLSLLFTGVTAEDVNLKLENIVLTYLGANWDIYFILFLFCILMFVISFRRQ
jgi:hypothetical protein